MRPQGCPWGQTPHNPFGLWGLCLRLVIELYLWFVLENNLVNKHRFESCRFTLSIFHYGVERDRIGRAVVRPTLQTFLDSCADDILILFPFLISIKDGKESSVRRFDE